MENEEHLGQAKIEFDGNHATASLIDEKTRIKTPEELIALLGIDLDVWEIERELVNKWEIARRNDQKQLEFSQGKIDGYISDDGDFTVEPLWQVKVWLVKKKPEPLEPVVQPIKINVEPIGLPTARRYERKRALLVFDPHFGFKRNIQTGKLTPFHDRTAISIAIQLAQQFGPDVFGLGGDGLDLADWSDNYVRSPEFYLTTQPALIECAWVLGQLRKYSQAGFYVPGNHEDRLTRAMQKHLYQVYNLKPVNRLKEDPPMTVQNLLGLEGMDIEYVGEYPDGEYYLNPFFSVIHGKIARQPGATSAAYVGDSQVSVAFGHIHRRELVSKTIWFHGESRVVEGLCPGCVCKIDGTVPGSTKNQNWQQGVAFVEYDDLDYNVDFIPIQDGEAYYRGSYFTARDYTKQLYAEYGEYFGEG